MADRAVPGQLVHSNTVGEVGKARLSLFQEPSGSFQGSQELQPSSAWEQQHWVVGVTDIRGTWLLVEVGPHSPSALFKL